MDTLERNLIIGFSVAILALIAGVVVALIFTRHVDTPIPSAVIPTATVAPPPLQKTSVLLKNNLGECFFLPSFKPSLGAPGPCNTGFWVINTTSNIVSFDGVNYEYCIQAPGTVSSSVLGSTSAGCTDITMIDGIIKAQTANLCVNEASGDFTWNTCDTAFKFEVDGL